MAKIVGMGEMLMRLSPEMGRRFTNTEDFQVFFGGSEANAVASCSDYGDEVSFITKLPKHDIGQAALNALRMHDVDTSFIVRGGDRLGIYFCDTGSSIRPTKVIYDRKDSSMALADPSEFDFDKAFEGADWFHWSGITAAISDSAAKCIELACKKAKEHGLKISCDLNYRAKLWSPEQACEVMVPLMEYVDVCIANESEASTCLGMEVEGKTMEEVLKKMKEIFNFETIVTVALDDLSASHNQWRSVLYNGAFYETKELTLLPILDRVGAGDAMAGGLIHALLKWNDPQKAIDFASAAGALKATVAGDLNNVTEDEVMALAFADTKGIQR